MSLDVTDIVGTGGAHVLVSRAPDVVRIALHEERRSRAMVEAETAFVDAIRPILGEKYIPPIVGASLSPAELSAACSESSDANLGGAAPWGTIMPNAMRVWLPLPLNVTPLRGVPDVTVEIKPKHASRFAARSLLVEPQNDVKFFVSRFELTQVEKMARYAMEAATVRSARSRRTKKRKMESTGTSDSLDDDVEECGEDMDGEYEVSSFQPHDLFEAVESALAKKLDAPAFQQLPTSSGTFKRKGCVQKPSTTDLNKCAHLHSVDLDDDDDDDDVVTLQIFRSLKPLLSARHKGRKYSNNLRVFINGKLRDDLFDHDGDNHAEAGRRLNCQLNGSTTFSSPSSSSSPSPPDSSKRLRDSVFADFASLPVGPEGASSPRHPSDAAAPKSLLHHPLEPLLMQVARVLSRERSVLQGLAQAQARDVLDVEGAALVLRRLATLTVPPTLQAAAERVTASLALRADDDGQHYGEGTARRGIVGGEVETHEQPAPEEAKTVRLTATAEFTAPDEKCGPGTVLNSPHPSLLSTSPFLPTLRQMVVIPEPPSPELRAALGWGASAVLHRISGATATFSSEKRAGNDLQAVSASMVSAPPSVVPAEVVLPSPEVRLAARATVDGLSAKECVSLLGNHLVALMASDCSIMVSLRAVHGRPARRDHHEDSYQQPGQAGVMLAGLGGGGGGGARGAAEGGSQEQHQTADKGSAIGSAAGNVIGGPHFEGGSKGAGKPRIVAAVDPWSFDAGAANAIAYSLMLTDVGPKPVAKIQARAAKEDAFCTGISPTAVSATPATVAKGSSGSSGSSDLSRFPLGGSGAWSGATKVLVI